MAPVTSQLSRVNGLPRELDILRTSTRAMTHQRIPHVVVQLDGESARQDIQLKSLPGAERRVVLENYPLLSDFNLNRNVSTNLPHSQQLTTGPYHEPVNSNPHPQTISLRFWSHPPIYVLVFRVVSFLHQNLVRFSPPLSRVQHIPTTFVLTSCA
jgi:hypothetical protein